MTCSALLTPLALSLALAGTAQAADVSAAPAGADTVFDLGPVTVSGRASSARSVLTSVDVLSGEALQGQSVLNTWELFRRMPGVQLTEFNQGTTSGKLSLRGFNGEGEVNAVKLLIDGVPSNSNDGNMPWIDAVWPLDLAEVSTVRGTNDPRFGLHQIGGHVEMATRQGGNYLAHRLGLDSLGQHDVQIALGRDEGDWTQNYVVGLRHGEGHRDHSASDRHVFGGKWFYQPQGQDWRVGLIARQHHTDAQEPGYLTVAQVAADPDQSPSYVATDGGERLLRQLSLQAEGQASRTLGWQLTLYRNQFKDERWVKFSAGVSQQERDTDETHLGLRASLRWQPTVSGLHHFALEAGADTETQDDASRRYLTVERMRTKSTRDQAWTQRNLGLWTQAVIEPLPALRIVPGLRLDRLGGHFDDRLNHKSAGINDYGTITQPKLSAVWTPRPGQSLYANWGRAFQVGVGSATFLMSHTENLEPSINDGWETGWKFQSPDLSGRIALWQQNASNEVMRKLNDPSNDSENIGATRRRGIDVQLRAPLARSLDSWLGVSRQQALIVRPDTTSGAVAGNALDHVPRWLYSAGSDWQAAPALKLSAWVQGQSNYEINRANTGGRFGAYALINLGASWQVAPGWTLSADLKNLSDRYNEYVWWDGSQSLHAPGAGRSLAIALRSAL